SDQRGVDIVRRPPGLLRHHLRRFDRISDLAADRGAEQPDVRPGVGAVRAHARHDLLRRPSQPLVPRRRPGGTHDQEGEPPGSVELAHASPAAAAVTDRILVSWSGGKDSCLTLGEILRDARFSVEALLTTVTEGFDRISMHGVRRVLLEQQAAALEVPLEVVYIPQAATNDVYQARMEAAFERYRAMGVTTIAFGDLFLADIRKYREQWLAQAGMTPIFPIW